MFTVIDLGDIHLMMEEDTSGDSLKSGRFFHPRFPNLKPCLKAEYEVTKAELLATSPKIDQPNAQNPLDESGKKGILSQNIPNPTNGSTVVAYDIFEEGTVEIRIYNTLGQLLQILPQGVKAEGLHQTESFLQAFLQR